MCADLGAGPDLDTGRGRGRRQGIRQRTRPAADEDRLAGRAAVIAGRVDQQDRRRARRPRAHRRVLHAAPGDGRPERIGLERFGHEVRDGHGQDTGDGPAVMLAQPTERPPEPEPGEGVAETGRLDVRRRLPGDVAEEAGQRPDEPVETGVVLGVGRGSGAQALRGPGRVAPQADRLAVGAGCERPDVRADERQAVALEIEITDDRWPEAPDGVGQRRDPRPGRELGRADRPTDGLATFEDDRPQAGLAKVRRGDQPVVAATDDDRVVLVGRVVSHVRHR